MRATDSIACAIMSFQQLTGVTFSSTYGPTFYRQIGLGANAFIYAAVNNATSVVTALAGMALLDTLGRRNLIMYGCSAQAIFLVIPGKLSRVY